MRYYYCHALHLMTPSEALSASALAEHLLLFCNFDSSSFTCLRQKLLKIVELSANCIAEFRYKAWKNLWGSQNVDQILHHSLHRIQLSHYFIKIIHSVCRLRQALECRLTGSLDVIALVFQIHYKLGFYNSVSNTWVSQSLQRNKNSIEALLDLLQAPNLIAEAVNTERDQLNLTLNHLLLSCAQLPPHKERGYCSCNCGNEGLVAIQPKFDASGRAGLLHHEPTARHMARRLQRGPNGDRHKDSGAKAQQTPIPPTRQSRTAHQHLSPHGEAIARAACAQWRSA